MLAKKHNCMFHKFPWKSEEANKSENQFKIMLLGNFYLKLFLVQPKNLLSQNLSTKCREPRAFYQVCFP